LLTRDKFDLLQLPHLLGVISIDRAGGE